MNEIFFRVDERLVHGQILFKWLEHASCSKLYIIDDQVATDPILQGVLTMTVPESVEVFFYSADEGAEAVMPDLLDFFMYCFYNSNYKYEYLGKTHKGAIIGNAAISLLEHMRKPATDALKASKRFDPPTPITHLAEYARPFVSIGNQTGEGWFLTGEMIELIHSGVNNIVCTQPFGCLPNHVVGKGVIKELRKHYPLSNIVAIDYDPGASEVNQLNRIKLMLSTAQKNLEKEEYVDPNLAKTLKKVEELSSKRVNKCRL